MHARALSLVAVALASIGVAVAADATGLLRALEGATITTRFSIRGTERPPKNLVIVAIDNKSLQDLNTYPFSRTFYAKVIDKIAAEHPAAIAFDIDLENRTTIGKQNCLARFACDDLALLTSIRNHSGVTVFGTTSTTGDGQILFLGSAEGTTLLNEVGSRPGVELFPSNQPGGVYRQMTYSVQGIDTLAVATVEVATHRRVPRSEFGAGNQWIDFVGPGHTIPYVSFSSVYDSKKYGASPVNFGGKIVVVGATELSLQDLHATSTDGQMPGPEIQANAIETVLRGLPLRSLPTWLDAMFIVLLGAGVPLASTRLRAGATTGVAVLLGVWFVVATQLAFDFGWVVAIVYPLLALVLSSYGTLSHQLHYAAVDAERARVHALFARFVPPPVVDELLARTRNGLRLRGIELDSTVMFCDLREFTAFAEGLPPARVIEVLNRYLSEMSEAILAHGGTLVAYAGDGIMSVFGAPLEQHDHADRALEAAREILQERLPRFNDWLRSEALGQGFRIGIGLNSGPVMSGNVGSDARLEYAAIGDTTNTAARLEAMTKGTRYQLFLGEATRSRLHREGSDLVFVEQMQLRGKEQEVRVWSVESPAVA